jgi:hypothetical protein
MVEDGLYLEGHEPDMYIIFQNLIENGLKYNESEMKRIHIRGGENDREILIIDNGLGIPQHNWRKVFEEGERLQEYHQKEGTGLGLHHVRELAQQNTQTIDIVKSELQEGTTIALRY